MWLLGVFFEDRRLLLDILELPSSVPAEEGGAGCRAPSALLTREGRRPGGGTVPSDGASKSAYNFNTQQSVFEGTVGRQPQDRR